MYKRKDQNNMYKISFLLYIKHERGRRRNVKILMSSHYTSKGRTKQARPCIATNSDDVPEQECSSVDVFLLCQPDILDNLNTL